MVHGQYLQYAAFLGTSGPPHASLGMPGQTIRRDGAGFTNMLGRHALTLPVPRWDRQAGRPFIATPRDFGRPGMTNFGKAAIEARKLYIRGKVDTPQEAWRAAN